METKVKSLGQRFAESEAYKTAAETKQLPSAEYKFGSFWEAESKALSSDPASAGDLIVPERTPGIVAPPQRRLFLRDLMPSLPLASGSSEFVQQTGFKRPRTTLRTAAAATATTLEVENSNGFAPGQQINVGGETRTIATVPDNDTITITAGLTGAHAIGVEVYATDGIIHPVAEGEHKPEAELTFDLTEAFARTIPAYVRASRQVLSDAGELQQHVDGQLRYAIALSEEHQFLFGSGTGQELTGLLTHADRQTYTASAGDSIADTLRKALTLVTLADLDASGIAISPQDWQTIDLSKATGTGEYMFHAFGTGLAQLLWRVPVVVTKAMPVGRAAVGAFNLAATIRDREQSNVRIAEQHADLFLRNQVVILGEERVALENQRPEAVVDVDLTA